ncbi:hypothetical protein HDU76_008286, partial [Blyttiomyces sp. JEL0837]
APGANGGNDAPTPVDVTMSPCHTFPPPTTLLWLRTSKNELQSSESGNCIHPVPSSSGGFKLQLGSDYCNKNGKDVLRSYPTALTGVTNFFHNIPVAIDAPCGSTLRTRKDFRDLNPKTEQASFFAALNTLRSIPSIMGRPNRYDDYVSLHGMGAQWFHGTPMFLPWHRYFIVLLEVELRSITGNPDFAHPYWDWDADSTTWWLPSTGMLNSTNFGTTGKGTTHCVTDGFMNGKWTPTDQSCLVRSYTPSSANGVVNLYSENYVVAMASANNAANPNAPPAYTNFYDFAMNVENGPHNNFHGAVAGNDGAPEMGDPAVSVNDPVFWQHHVNIDRIYDLFQQYFPKLATVYDGAIGFPPATQQNFVSVSKSDMLTGFNVPASWGLQRQVGPYCHKYIPHSGSLKSGVTKQTILARRGDVKSKIDPAILAIMDRNVDILCPDQDESGDNNNDITTSTTLSDIATVQVKSTTAAPVTPISPGSKHKNKHKGKSSKPPRKMPSAVPDIIHMRMRMKMSLKEIREHEKKVFEFIKDMSEKEDVAMKEFFGKESFDLGTYEEQAFVFNYVVACNIQRASVSSSG